MRSFILTLALCSCLNAAAEPRAKQVQFMCGSEDDALITVERYGEKLITATLSPDGQLVNMVYINFETQTSSWFIHDLRTDEYCMMGIGTEIYVPPESPLIPYRGVLHYTQH